MKKLLLTFAVVSVSNCYTDMNTIARFVALGGATFCIGKSVQSFFEYQKHTKDLQELIKNETVEENTNCWKAQEQIKSNIKSRVLEREFKELTKEDEKNATDAAESKATAIRSFLQKEHAFSIKKINANRYKSAEEAVAYGSCTLLFLFLATKV